jgi:predicted DNA-binding transcriptional regulator AlpA
MEHQGIAPYIFPTTFNQKQAALYCGVSYSTFRRWRKRVDFPQPCVFGTLTRWRVADLDAFIAANIQFAEVAR